MKTRTELIQAGRRQARHKHHHEKRRRCTTTVAAAASSETKGTGMSNVPNAAENGCEKMHLDIREVQHG